MVREPHYASGAPNPSESPTRRPSRPPGLPRTACHLLLLPGPGDTGPFLQPAAMAFVSKAALEVKNGDTRVWSTHSGRGHAPWKQTQVKYSEEPTSPRLLFLTVTGQNLQPWAASTP